MAHFWETATENGEVPAHALCPECGAPAETLPVLDLAPAEAPPDTTTTAAPRNSQTGQASWYDAPAGTCAHRSLPFGTIVTVTNQSSGASTTCRVADRGPFVAGRIIDLSRDTFAKIASTSSGVIQVRIEW